VPVGTARADLAAVGAGGVAGRVYVEASNEGVAAAPVTCRWSGLDGILGTADDGTFGATASADGTFALIGVPYGTYECAAADPRGGTTTPAVRGEVASATAMPLALPVPSPITVAATTSTTPGALAPMAFLPRTGGGGGAVPLARVLVAVGACTWALAAGGRRDPGRRRSGARARS
jgi:hypothetical protein